LAAEKHKEVEALFDTTFEEFEESIEEKVTFIFMKYSNFCISYAI
jgi:hypothetical protein